MFGWLRSTEYALGELRNRKSFLHWQVRDVVQTTAFSPRVAQILSRPGELLLQFGAKSRVEIYAMGGGNGFSGLRLAPSVAAAFSGTGSNTTHLSGYSPLMTYVVAQCLHWKAVGVPADNAPVTSEMVKELARSASQRAKLARKNSTLALGQALASADGPFAGVQTLIAMKSSVRVRSRHVRAVVKWTRMTLSVFALRL